MNSLNSQYNQISSFSRQNRFQNTACYLKAKRIETLLKNINKFIWLEFLPFDKS